MAGNRSYEFGPFKLEEGMLFRDGQRVALTPKVVETLQVLVEADGRLVSKDELMRRVWPDTFVDETSLTSNISLLRKALGARGDKPYIQTIPKRGYRFVPPQPGAHVGEIIMPPRRLQHIKRWIAAAAVLLLGIALALVWRSGRQAGPEKRAMLVVLPVQNLSGDSERDYLADGLTEEIIAQLSRYNPERLGVIARTSAMTYKGTHKTVLQIGRELPVDFVLESSLRVFADRLRITAQLVRVRDQTQLWSASYDRSRQDLFSLEDEVARAIALNIQVKVAAATQTRLAAARPIKPDAYVAYLEGRYYWNQRSPDSLQRAIVHLQQAVAIDPDYALAYAGLADAYASECLIADVPAAEVFPKAKAAARKALNLDDQLAEGHTALAYVEFWWDWDWPGAEREFQRAIDLNPGYATAHQWYAEYLRLMGRYDEAIEEGSKALALDPLSLIINMESALPYYFQHRFSEALPPLRKTLEMDPNFGLARCVLGWTLDAAGQHHEAIAELERARQLDDSAPVLSALGHAYAAAGRPADAKSMLLQMQLRSRDRYISPFFFAAIHTGLRQNQQALDALENAYGHHDWALVWIMRSIALEPLHGEPRFLDLVHRLNLPG